METIQYMLEGFGNIFAVVPLLAIAAGVFMGILVGAMPGLSPSMGVALLLPFTFRLDPLVGLVMLTAVYLASNYGGSITAVTINTPGTPSAVATAFDGYPLTQQGKAGIGLGHSLVSSVVGGMVGIIILILFAQPLAKVAVRMHPAEYFALALFGLTTVASLGGKNWAKAFVAALIGLLINTVGIDPISSVKRFTFGATNIFDGFDIIPALIGLFALSEVFSKLEARETKSIDVGDAETRKDTWPTLKEYWNHRRVTLQSSVFGTLIGIFPGAGSAIASFLAYDLAKRTSKHPETFGKGNPEGVCAAEAANSASVGGAMVPLLTLGIPGSAATAVLVGALMIHDLVPGPMLFTSNPGLVYGLFASMLVANIFMLFVGGLGGKLWLKVINISPAVLMPMIIAVAFIGSFAVKNSLFDVAACFVFGVVGWALKRKGYPMAPIVLGMVLGKLAEVNFRRAVIMGGYSVFFTRPASLALLLISVAAFALPFWQSAREKKKALKGK
ncbi:MAG: tripartite tricarboxylate transporter permease [Spirochaetia bacterium]|jgi:putative tricarboxylic transport membrane protein|nr:tripartite tricarboxylate transporter permease [Spirochaetia bacterium]